MHNHPQKSQQTTEMIHICSQYNLAQKMYIDGEYLGNRILQEHGTGSLTTKKKNDRTKQKECRSLRSRLPPLDPPPPLMSASRSDASRTEKGQSNREVRTSEKTWSV